MALKALRDDLNGERKPRVFLAVRIAIASGMEPGEFFTALADAMKEAE